MPDANGILSNDEARQQMWALSLRHRDTGVAPTSEEIHAIRVSLEHHRPLFKPRNVPDPVVYYFRVGNRVKIGFTANLEHRVRSLMPEEVLGWESGERALETKRHRQFARYREAREWFEDCAVIRRHIAENCRQPCP